MSGWKPGDVALTSKGTRALLVGRKWIAQDGAPWSNERFPSNLRPLVVIDPEDAEQVERLAAIYARQPHGAFLSDLTAELQAALREFANPTPPKPAEPTGLGAVVEDADGIRWVRRGRTHFVAAEGSPPAEYNTSLVWAEIAAVRVLSPGVEADA